MGLLPGTARAAERKEEAVQVIASEESILGSPGSALGGIWSNEWEIQLSEAVVSAAQIFCGGQRRIGEGFSPGAQIFCSTALLNMATNAEVASHVVDALEVQTRIAGR